MIQLDGLNSGCIEWNSILSSRLFKQVLLADKQELSLRVHEALNQPWARDAVHFNVFTGNPFHRHLTVGTRVNQNGGTNGAKSCDDERCRAERFQGPQSHSLSVRLIDANFGALFPLCSQAFNCGEVLVPGYADAAKE